MRILYIHQYFATRRGRTGTRSLEQAQAMRRAGHEVTMLTSSAQLLTDEVPEGEGAIRRGVIEGIPCIVVDVPYSQGMSYARRIWSFLAFMFWACWLVLRLPRPDLVFATSTPLTIGVPALVGRWFRRIPFIFEVRDLWPDVPRALGAIRSRGLFRMLAWLERCIYRHATALVAVNADVARKMRERGRPGQSLIVVPNACDIDLFRPDRDGGWFRQQHNLQSAVLAVHTGTMGPVNGIDCILDAAKQLKDIESFRVALIGSGNQKDRIRQRVADEEIGNVLVLDALPKERLADVLATADIGLMTVAPIPILELNCANKYFDYLASGLPVVLNYQGWQADILREHGCGFSAPQGDDAAFAARIRELACDATRRADMAARARRAAETTFSRAEVVRPLLELLSRATAAGR